MNFLVTVCSSVQDFEHSMELGAARALGSNFVIPSAGSVLALYHLESPGNKKFVLYHLESPGEFVLYHIESPWATASTSPAIGAATAMAATDSDTADPSSYYPHQ
jgi:hypothetical protein